MSMRIVHFLAAAALATGLASGPALAEQPIVIGISGPFTGPSAFLGQHQRWGAELAVAQINAAGGVLGRQLEIAAEDNACNPSEGVTSVSRLINDKHAVALVGALCSSVTLAAMPVAERNKVPLVVSIATAKAIADQAGAGGNQWVFKTNPSDDGLAGALAKYLHDQGKVTNVAVVGEDTDYGRGGAAALAATLPKDGIAIKSTDYYQKGAQDFSTVLLKLQAERPSAIATYMMAADQLNFYRQYQMFGLTIPFTGRPELGGLQKAVVTSGALNGSSSVFPYSAEVDTPANKKFVAEFQAKYNQEPIYQSFEAYEAINIVADAIKRAGKVDPAAIQDALAKTKYPSMMGATVEFDDHHQAHNNAVIMEVRDNKVVVVALNKT